MEFKKKTIIWEDNNEPPKDYIGVKSDGKAYEYSYSQRKGIESKLIKTEESGGSDEGGSGSMSMYDAWMKAFKGLKHEDCPVAPKKVVRGWFGNYALYGTTENTINLDFCNTTTNTLYTQEGATIYDIENVPDDIYDTEDYNFATFLYDLDELNQYENISGPIQALINSGLPFLNPYGNTLSRFNVNVISIDGKYYVWFQDWD